MILRDLPERERAEFLRQYHEAVDAAHDLAGYRRLRSLLHVWQLAVAATRQPGYYEELRAVRDGVARTTPADEAIPGWHERCTGPSRSSCPRSASSSVQIAANGLDTEYGCTRLSRCHGRRPPASASASSQPRMSSVMMGSSSMLVLAATLSGALESKLAARGAEFVEVGC